MCYKTVTFDDVYNDILMTSSLWKEVKDLDEKNKKEKLKNSLFWPEGFLEQLKGLSLEKQMDYYGISTSESYSKSSYGEVDNISGIDETFKLSDYQGLNALIVENEILIGVCIDCAFTGGPWGAPLFPYQDVCTYIGSDNNGSGTSDREDYAHLFCIKK